MPNKDETKPVPKQERELEARVDAMMDPTKPDVKTSPIKAIKVESEDSLPPLDIFKDPKTAPEVPKNLLEDIGAADSAVNSAPKTPKSPVAAGDDPETEAAVNDIAAHEGDELLAAEDAAKTKAVTPKSPPKTKLAALFHNKWFWIAGALLVIAAALAIPFSRYRVLGLVVKHNFEVKIVDSTTNTPVSSAAVWLAGKAAKTDGSGKAHFRVPVGHGLLTIKKQYYKDYKQDVLVPFRNSNGAFQVKLVATGRQVPIVVINKITGQGVAGAEVKAGKIDAKTDKAGKATIVLPTLSAAETASVELAGYNTAQVKIQVTDKVLAANTFALTPAGKIYFLSNQTGKIDVVKTNLDGSDRQIVLAATGKEDTNNTILLASRDWRYLVLKARRDSTAALYIIDTSNDKVTQFDSGNANFTLVGWYNHYFVYNTARNAIPVWQTGHEALKSYNAESSQLNILDQSQAAGDASNYTNQNFANFYILSDGVVYNALWNGTDLAGKTNIIRGAQANGSGKKDYQTYDAANSAYPQAVLYKPNSIYYSIYNYDDKKTNYYEFENGAVKTASLDPNIFAKAYPTYLVSPSGSLTFWTELRDGKNSLFVGDQDAKNQVQVSATTDYSPYGWYGDGYLLASKNSSELYIMPNSDLKSTAPPLKITDYYKPAGSFYGYGYGYGGL
ncbi:MAG TPA: hypothetical protein VLG37_05605 [Candidatus Saccharimonadales bacterium]|nr:hypothetical protein [Candidatus Saccharimonadales bacterium]